MLRKAALLELPLVIELVAVALGRPARAEGSGSHERRELEAQAEFELATTPRSVITANVLATFERAENPGADPSTGHWAKRIAAACQAVSTLGCANVVLFHEDGSPAGFVIPPMKKHGKQAQFTLRVCRNGLSTADCSVHYIRSVGVSCLTVGPDFGQDADYPQDLLQAVTYSRNGYRKALGVVPDLTLACATDVPFFPIPAPGKNGSYLAMDAYIFGGFEGRHEGSAKKVLAQESTKSVVLMMQLPPPLAQQR
jgi:hypothetical protein